MRRLSLTAALLLLAGCAQVPPLAQMDVQLDPAPAPAKPPAPQPLTPSPAPQAVPSFDGNKMAEDVKNGSVLTERWIRCTQAYSRKLALSSQESAATIIRATFGACSSLEEDYFLYMLKHGMNLEVSENTKRRIRVIAEEHMTSDILTLRAAPPPPPAPAKPKGNAI